jgi:hypothetical protein
MDKRPAMVLRCIIPILLTVSGKNFLSNIHLYLYLHLVTQIETFLAVMEIMCVMSQAILDGTRVQILFALLYSNGESYVFAFKKPLKESQLLTSF